MSRETLELNLSDRIVNVFDADEVDESADSPALLAREAARGALAEFGEEPEAVYEMDGGWGVIGDTKAVFMGDDGSFAIEDVPEDDDDTDPDPEDASADEDYDDDDDDDDLNEDVFGVDDDDDDLNEGMGMSRRGAHKMECMECGAKFTKKNLKPGASVKCPKCGSTDVELAESEPVSYQQVMAAVEKAILNKSVTAEGLEALRAVDAAVLNEDSGSLRPAIKQIEEAFGVEVEIALPEALNESDESDNEIDFPALNLAVAEALSLTDVTNENRHYLVAFDAAIADEDAEAALTAMEAIEEAFGIKMPPMPKKPSNDGPGDTGGASVSRLKEEDDEDEDEDDDFDESLGYKLKAGDRKMIAAFVKGEDGSGIKAKNLDIEGDYLTGPSRGKGQPLATRKGSTITIGDPQGNVSQTWVNAIRKAAKAAGLKIMESDLESSDDDDLDERKKSKAERKDKKSGKRLSKSQRKGGAGADSPDAEGDDYFEDEDDDDDAAEVTITFPEARLKEFVEVARKCDVPDDVALVNTGGEVAVTLPEALAEGVRQFFTGDDVVIA
jgi:predicted Zn-ribbon and HTH transcriptional regulator